jgi:hypothetical protein
MMDGVITALWSRQPAIRNRVAAPSGAWTRQNLAFRADFIQFQVD